MISIILKDEEWYRLKEIAQTINKVINKDLSEGDIVSVIVSLWLKGLKECEEEQR